MSELTCDVCGLPDGVEHDEMPHGFEPHIPQWQKCLRGEHEAHTGIRLFTDPRGSFDSLHCAERGNMTPRPDGPREIQVCKHCRCLYVERG